MKKDFPDCMMRVGCCWVEILGSTLPIVVILAAPRVRTIGWLVALLDTLTTDCKRVRPVMFLPLWIKFEDVAKSKFPT